jgi:hypothetical protein
MVWLPVGDFPRRKEDEYMIGAALLVLAAAWTVVTIDAIAESAKTDARDIVVFGNTILEPGSPGGVWILVGMAVVALVIWALWISYARGHRLEQRVTAELEEGWSESPPVRDSAATTTSPVEGGEPGSPPRTAAEIEEEMGELALRRDELFVELKDVQAQIRRLEQDSRAEPWHEQVQDALVVLPEFNEDELASRRSARTGDDA